MFKFKKQTMIEIAEEPKNCREVLLKEIEKLVLQQKIIRNMLLCVIIGLLAVILLILSKSDKVNKSVWRTYYLNKTTFEQVNKVSIDHEGHVSLLH